MTELDEVAKSIYEKDRNVWPINWREAKALAYVYIPSASQALADSLADALMRINHEAA